MFCFRKPCGTAHMLLIMDRLGTLGRQKTLLRYDFAKTIAYFLTKVIT